MRYLSTLLLSVATIWAYAAPTTYEVMPGKMKYLLTTLPAGTTEVKFVGNIDIRDLQALAVAEPLVLVDLGDTNITEYTSTVPLYQQMTWFEANVLPQYIFMGSDFGTLVLPNSLEYIGEGAFAASTVTTLAGGASVKEIGEFAFRDCKNLTEVPAWKSLANVGMMAFAGCESLKKVDLSLSNVSDIPERCFAGCSSLKSVAFPTTPLSIGAEAFAGSGIAELSGLKVNALADFALADAPHLDHATISGKVDAQGLFFNDNALSTVDIELPDNLPAYYFGANRKLGVSNLLTNATSIGDMALAGITDAEYMALGGNLKYVGNEAFYGMTNLKTISAKALEDKIPAIGEDAFKGLDQGNIELEVSDVEIWMQAEGWNKFKVVNHSSVAETLGESAGEISISLVGSVLNVQSSEPLTYVEVYDINGVILLTARPDATAFSTELAQLPVSGMILVRAATEKGEKSAKVIF